MQKKKTFEDTRFPSSVIEEAYKLFIEKNKEAKNPWYPTTNEIRIGNETLAYDSVEEFLIDFPKSDSANFYHEISEKGSSFSIQCYNDQTTIGIRFKNRSDIEAVFQIFERNATTCKIERIEIKPQIKIFIGHGHNDQWRDLKDHLHDMHGYEVNHYEIGPRAGTSVKDVLQKMLSSSSIAFLVLTGEDLTTDGTTHARENVIHEVGLFQGHLGFTRAIVLKEDGVHEFSNILGMNQIRFSKGNIKETFGDVIATIKREFE